MTPGKREVSVVRLTSKDSQERSTGTDVQVMPTVKNRWFFISRNDCPHEFKGRFIFRHMQVMSWEKVLSILRLLEKEIVVSDFERDAKRMWQRKQRCAGQCSLEAGEETQGQPV